MTIISIRIVVNVYNLLHIIIFFFFHLFCDFFHFFVQSEGTSLKILFEAQLDRTSAKEFVSLLYYLITFFFLFFFFFLQRTVLHREKSNRFTPRTRFPIFFPSLSRELLCMHFFFLSLHSYFSFLLTSLSHPYYIFISWSLSLLSSKGFNSSFTIFISLFFFELPSNI